MKTQGKPNGFDIHYFNLLAGINIRDVVVPEIQLEHEHGNEIAVRAVEPVIGIDYMDLDGSDEEQVISVLAGVNFYPHHSATSNLIVRVAGLIIEIVAAMWLMTPSWLKSLRRFRAIEPPCHHGKEQQ